MSLKYCACLILLILGALFLTKCGIETDPFNPDTEINFEISSRDNFKNCKLEIYNVKGQLVKTLLQEALPAGPHKIIWNGRDDQANPVASGVYFFNLRIDSRSLPHKMLLLK